MAAVGAEAVRRHEELPARLSRFGGAAILVVAAAPGWPSPEPRADAHRWSEFGCAYE
jgi:hypothetical protein